MFSRDKLLVVFVIFITLFFLLSGAVYYRSIVKGSSYKTIADAQYEYKVNTGDANYVLTDCSGNNLLKYKKKYYVDIVSPDFLYNDISSDEFITLDLILKNYNKNYDIMNLLNNNKGLPVSLEVNDKINEKISMLKGLKGVYTYTFNTVDMDNAWTIENMIFSGIKSAGEVKSTNDSLEKKLFESVKFNKFDEYVFTKDINRNIIVGKENLNSQNVNIKLTLDKNIQENIKKIISSDAYNNFAQVGVILMDDQGKIKALVQKDDSLPNINLSVILYPGSIFKTIVEEAAIENNKLSLTEKFTCRGVNEGETHRLHGNLTVAQAFSISCNDIFSQIGNKIGGDAIIKCAANQGIFDKALGLSLEQKGSLDKKTDLSDGSLGLTAIGQNLRITPIEALCISSTVINGGKFVKPKIIDGIFKNGNETFSSNDNSTVAISKGTANIIKRQMMDVVKNGTAKATYTNKIEIGGKTGTTERKGNAPGDISENSLHSDGWFVGFFKFDEKYYSMIVCVQDIDLKTQSGGNTAAEIFKDIALKCTGINK